MSFRKQQSNMHEKCPWLRMKLPLLFNEYASSDSVHTARYNSSLHDGQLLSLQLWTHPHSSTQMKAMFRDMAFSREEMANEQEKQNVADTIRGDAVTVMPTEAKSKEALEAEKPSEASKTEKLKEASSQKQNLISSKTDVPYKRLKLNKEGKALKVAYHV